MVGTAMRSDRLGETLLPKRIALPVFASGALSSVTYAPDEIFLTLVVSGGAFATTHSWQIGVVVFVMLIVVASYRQNVHAYPSGGGDYEVATVNLGPRAGLTVASALLVDNVLAVSPVVAYVKSVRRSSPRDVVMVYIPEYVVGRWYEQLLHNLSALRLKGRLFFTPGVMVASVPWQLRSSDGVGERFNGPTAGSVRRGE
jgi:amino acid transporter